MHANDKWVFRYYKLLLLLCIELYMLRHLIPSLCTNILIPALSTLTHNPNTKTKDF